MPRWDIKLPSPHLISILIFIYFLGKYFIVKSIWIIKHYGSIPNVPGGARQYEFARELAKKGMHVAYFIPSFSHILHREIKRFENPLYHIERRNGIYVVWIKSFPYYTNNWRRALNAFDFACRVGRVAKVLSNSEMTISRPDKILCFNLPLLTPIVAQHITKRLGAKFYLEIGDLWPQTLIDMGVLNKNNPVTWLMLHAERFLYRKAESIITPLPNVSEYLDSKGFSSKVTFIGSGVDLGKYAFAKLPGESKFETNTFTLIYTGAHGRANNLLPVIQALGWVKELDHEEIRLVLVGDGIEKPMLKDYVRRKNIDNVIFMDVVPKNEVAALLLKADACLFRLINIGVFKYGINPNKLNDYLCAGKPILFFAEGKNNVVDEVGCGISVSSSDPEKMARAIINLANMSISDRNRMAERARRYAEENLSIDLVIKRLMLALNL